MMIFIHVGLNRFHDCIVAKSMNSSNAFLISKANIVIYYVAILRVRGHPHCPIESLPLKAIMPSSMAICLLGK